MMFGRSGTDDLTDRDGAWEGNANNDEKTCGKYEEIGREEQGQSRSERRKTRE